MRIFKKGELGILWPFYLDAILSPMLFFLPAFMILYFIKAGFSMFQIGVFLSAMPLASLLFEVPTGAIADLYGRKFSVLLGIFLQGAIALLFYFTTNFWAIAGLFALWGVSSTFISGASEAWTTDLIKKRNKDLLHGFFTKKSSLDSAGLLISGILGAYVVSLFGLSVIWGFTALSWGVSFVILMFGKEEFVRQKQKSVRT